jgi:hypothetical protein
VSTCAWLLNPEPALRPHRLNSEISACPLFSLAYAFVFPQALSFHIDLNTPGGACLARADSPRRRVHFRSSPLFSDICRLFAPSSKLKCFRFNGLRPLAQKTRMRVPRGTQSLSCRLSALGRVSSFAFRVSLFSEKREELDGVDAGAIQGEAPMKMGAGDASGGADFAEERAGLDQIAGLHGDGLKVAVKSVQAKAVIKDDGVAGEIQRLGEHDTAALRGEHVRACWGREIGATMRRAGLSIEDAPLAKIASGVGAVERQTEASLPQALRTDGGENGAQLLALRFGAGELLGIGLDEIGRDGEALGGELAFFDGDAGRAVYMLRRITAFSFDGQSIGARFQLEIDAEERSPNLRSFCAGIVRFALLPERDFFFRPGAFHICQRIGAAQLQQQQAALCRQRGADGENPATTRVRQGSGRCFAARRAMRAAGGLRVCGVWRRDDRERAEQDARVRGPTSRSCKFPHARTIRHVVAHTKAQDEYVGVNAPLLCSGTACCATARGACGADDALSA